MTKGRVLTPTRLSSKCSATCFAMVLRAANFWFTLTFSQNLFSVSRVSMPVPFRLAGFTFLNLETL